MLRDSWPFAGKRAACKRRKPAEELHKGLGVKSRSLGTCMSQGVVQLWAPGGCSQAMHLRAGLFLGLWLLLAPSLAEPSPGPGAATLAIVFDVTGSMYDDLMQVIEGASRIMEKTLSKATKAISNYVLVPFHDPGKAVAVLILGVWSLQSLVVAVL